MKAFKRSVKRAIRGSGFVVVRADRQTRGGEGGTDAATFSVQYIPKVLDGSEYMLPLYALNRSASRAILNDRFYEQETHDFVRKLFAHKPGAMIHAGTFFGDMLPNFAAAATRVYAFEPVLENFVLAKICVDRNALDTVILSNAALSSETGVVRINSEDPNTGDHFGGGSRVAETGTLTAAFRIDDIATQRLELIQLDVERHELDALRGAVATIERDQPLILIEDNAAACDDFLTAQGYVRLGQVGPNTLFAASERVGEYEFLTL